MSIAACVIGQLEPTFTAVAASLPAARQPMALGVFIPIVAALGLAAVAWAWWVRPMNLALGLATTVAMWTLSYIALLQPGLVAGDLLFGSAILCVVIGGFVAGRIGSPHASGLSVGLISAAFNTMVVGSVAGKQQGDSALLPVLYVAGLIAASALLGWVGQLFGARSRKHESAVHTPTPDAAVFMCTVNAVGIFVMIVLGGLVTSMEAGLAVPDWPHTFGHNMLLFPMTQMKGGVFYEHAHRLFGTLVGVATLVTWATVFKTQSRRAPRILVSVVLLLVIAQGILGGLRVTGMFTTATDAAQLKPSTTDGIIHGMLGQVVFALAAVLPLTLTARWASASPMALPSGRAIRTLPALGLAAILVQLFLGVAMRHLQIPPTATEGAQIPKWAFHGHLTMSVVVLVVVFVAGLRCGQVNELPWLKRNGKAVMHTIGLQVMLGIFALVAVLVRRGESVPWWEVTAATAHQAVGALLLALTVMLVAQSRRFVARA